MLLDTRIELLHTCRVPEDLWLTERPLRQTISGAGVLEIRPAISVCFEGI